MPEYDDVSITWIINWIDRKKDLIGKRDYNAIRLIKEHCEGLLKGVYDD
jgi:hypothetical protein